MPRRADLGAWIGLAVALLLGLFVPALGRLAALLVLMLPINHGARCRLALGAVVGFYSAVIVASRGIALSSSDDFGQNYLPIYMEFARGDFSRFFSFGEGYEVGISGLLGLLSLFLGSDAGRMVMFCLVFFSFTLLLIWLQVFALDAVEKKHRSLCVALTVGLCSAMMASQTMRQFISSIFILMALSSQRRMSQGAFLSLATAFHLTAVPVFALLVVAKKYPRIVIGAIACLGAFVFLTPDGFLSQGIKASGLIVGMNKFTYYSGKGIDNSGWGSNGGIILFIQIVFLLIISSIRGGSELRAEWRKIILVLGVLYIALLPIPLAAQRATLLLGGVGLGYAYFIATSKSYFRALTVLMAVYFIYGTVNSFFPDEADPFRFWVGYEYMGYFPGYFWAPMFGSGSFL